MHLIYSLTTSPEKHLPKRDPLTKLFIDLLLFLNDPHAVKQEISKQTKTISPNSDPHIF
jgi:hypothetical protein